MRSLFSLAVAAPLAWSGLAHSSSAQGLGVGINLGGLGVGVNIGSPSTPANPSTGLNLNLSLGGLGVDVGVGAAGSSSDSSSSGQAVELSQEAMLEAVSSKRALPLDVILARAHLLTTGEIVDARLITYRNFLLYDLKVLAATGDVSELYFYARSGVPVQTR